MNIEYTYSIYQTETRSYCFMPFEYAMNHGLSQDDYTFCIKGKIEASCINEVLEKLWVRYNADDRPLALQMRSLSMSDVVVLEAKSDYVDFGPTPYYCDRYGWSEIPRDIWK